MSKYDNTATKQLISDAQNGNDEATRKIVEENTGLIWSIVRRFMGRGVETEDLYQIGSIGLLKAIRNFDFSYEVCFSTYAVPLIIGEIRRFLRDDGCIKVSRSIKELYLRIKEYSEEVKRRGGDEPTVKEICREMNVDTEEVILALDSNMPIQSIYEVVNDSSSSPVYMIDKLSSEEKLLPGNKNACDEFDFLIDSIALRDCISSLSSLDKRIITLRYYEQLTQSQVAQILCMSQVAISRSEKRILTYIRSQMLK